MRLGGSSSVWGDEGAVVGLVDVGVKSKGLAIAHERCDARRLSVQDSGADQQRASSYFTSSLTASCSPSLSLPSLSEATASAYFSKAVCGAFGFHFSSNVTPSSRSSMPTLSLRACFHLGMELAVTVIEGGGEVPSR